MTLNYYQYLKTKEWKAKAKACRKRAKYRCQICGTSSRELHAHHNNYDRLGDEKPTDLTCLCDECHKFITIMLKQRRMK